MYKHTSVFVDFCREKFNLDNQIYYQYQSLSVCMIDCVFSLRSNYANTIKVVNRYASLYLGGDVTRSGDSVLDLIDHINKAGGPTEFASADYLDNSQKSGGVLKTVVCLTLAQYLSFLGINTLEDFRNYEHPEILEIVIHAIKGIGDAGTNYLFMLAGDPNRCKLDTHIRKCVSDACGDSIGQRITDEDCQLLFRETVDELKKEYSNLTVATLDGIIWQAYRNE